MKHVIMKTHDKYEYLKTKKKGKRPGGSPTEHISEGWIRITNERENGSLWMGHIDDLIRNQIAEGDGLLLLQ